MFNYLACAWNADNDEQVAAMQAIGRQIANDTRKWTTVFDRGGLRVYCSGGGRPDGDHVLPLGCNSGVVLGTVFERSPAGDASWVKQTFSDRDSAQVRESSGRALCERYWGRYVAFLNDAATGVKHVIRDPGGAMDCLHANYRGVRIFFSSLQYCPPCKLLRLSTNWQYISTAICCSTLSDTRQTGFVEITRVLGGECAQVGATDTTYRFYWNPCSIATAPPAASIDEVTPIVRTAVRTCVEAWAARHSRLVHLLSGGLDSSIVFAFLKTAPNSPAVTCVNYFHKAGSVGDERRFARLCMQDAGANCTLLELPSDTSFDLAAVMRPPLSCSPSNYFTQGPAKAYTRIARQHGATACFSGSGGDELFYQAAHFVCADFARTNGLTPGLFRLAMHMARVERDSVWHILRSAVRDGLLNSPQVPLQRDCIGYSNLARDDVVEAVKAGQLFIHPWLKTEALPSPGKCWQIFGLSRPNPVYEPFAEPGDPENVEPLCSQPVVEACLRIPTYLLAARSRDRVVARQAFARDLPTEIVKRRAKGITHDYMQALLLQNIGRMREALLDGALIRERILNESKVIEALTGGPSKGAVYAPELFLCFSVESWLDTWGASARGRVAA